MDPTQPPTQQPPQTTPEVIIPQPKPNYLKTIIFSVLIMMTLGLIAYLIFQNQKLQKQISNQQIVPTIETPSPTPKTVSSISIPADEMSNWKTYAITEFGFELKISPEWKFQQVTDVTGKPSPSYWAGPKDLSEKQNYTLNLFIYDNPQKLTSKQFVYDLIKRNNAQPGSQTYENREEISLNGIAATKLSGVFAFDRSEEEIFVSNNKYIYQFNFPVASENPNILDPIHNNAIANQILSTFKFTDTN